MLPTTTYADCQSDFEKNEPDFKVTYEYNADTDDFTIILPVPNVNNYGFIFYHSIDSSNAAENNGKQAIIIKGYKKDTYTYGIKANTGACKDTVVKQETIKLEKTNPYVNDPLCKGNEEFILCQKDYNYAAEINREAFESRLKAYIESKDDKDTQNKDATKDNKDSQKTNDDNNKDSFIIRIINYISENIVNTIAIAIFIISLMVTIVLKIKSEIRSRRLE